MFLNGTAMSGQKDHGAIAGATFVGPARTAPRYRFFAVRDEFPGLYPVAAGGAAVEGELYELTSDLGTYFGEGLYGIVPVRLTVPAGTGALHVPLLASPWSYTTYRGS
jgi:gamma-glutamylcyclotransferase (GGCT)/AIG2-like uncharacterized protein YtfP